MPESSQLVIESIVNVLILEGPHMEIYDCERRDSIVARIRKVESERSNGNGLIVNELTGISVDQLHTIGYVVMSVKGRYEGFIIKDTEVAKKRLAEYTHNGYISGIIIA